MKKTVSFSPLVMTMAFAAGLLAAGASAAQNESPGPKVGGEYSIVVEGYDWGAGVSKVILSLDETVSSANAGDYTVSVKRHTDCVELRPDQAAGERIIIHAYVSDARGKPRSEGGHVTLVLAVAPRWILGNPIQYVRSEKCRGNLWVDYELTVTDTAASRVWDTEIGRIMPLVDRFDLSGRYVHDTGTALSYASFVPETDSERSPLLIWLHGGGEGGTDPTIPLLGNRAANYASDEIQVIFDGAYVLVPQCPGAWMHNTEGVMTHGQEDDVYNVALMALIRDYVAAHPGIDTDRIYVGGCSNGGYMSLKLLLLYPDYFAAGFISSLAYQSQYLTDEQIQSIAHLPIWFVHSADDQTTVPDKTVLPVLERLKAAGARHVHASYYDHVVDITGFFGGEDYHYNGHWSWVYLHANQCRRDLDGSPVTLNGRPVTVMEWLAAQTRAK
jgi:predicted esterase